MVVVEGRSQFSKPLTSGCTKGLDSLGHRAEGGQSHHDVGWVLEGKFGRKRIRRGKV